MIFILQGSEKVCFQGCVNSLPQQEERSSNLGIELLPSPVRIWRLSSIRDVSLSLVSSRSATSLVFKYSSEVELAWGLALCIKWVGPATGSTLHSTQMAVDCLSASQLDYLLLFSMHLQCINANGLCVECRVEPVGPARPTQGHPAKGGEESKRRHQSSRTKIEVSSPNPVKWIAEIPM